jgi:hypothetical protein
MVIIHTCEGAYSGCWGWLVNKQSGVSAHYVVKEDGSEISQLVKEADKALAHRRQVQEQPQRRQVRPSSRARAATTSPSASSTPASPTRPRGTANLIEQSAKLVCDITKPQRHPRDKYHIVGHGQLQPYNRSRPRPQLAVGHLPQQGPEPLRRHPARGHAAAAAP